MTPRIILANLMVRLRSLSRERSAMFFALAFPVLLVLVFGAIFTKPEHLNFDLPVQDLDHTAASAKFIDSLAADGLFKAIPVPADAGAVQYAKEHALTLVFIIPGASKQRRCKGSDREISPPRSPRRTSTTQARHRSRPSCNL